MKILSLVAASLFVLCALFVARPALAETVTYYHTDQVGTPLAMTDANGIKVWEADYLPFGEVYTESGVANDRKFVGKERDEESGLDYFGARYHYAKIGRFLAPDPVRAVDTNSGKVSQKFLEHPQRLNLYSYSMNNPARWVDPDGRDVEIVIDRISSTPKSIMGTIDVKSTTTKSRFQGYTLENNNPPNKNLPVPSGEYQAFVREDHTPNRIELINVPKASNVQIHIGNKPSDVIGCFAVGTTAQSDLVLNSKKAMNNINSIVKEDGSRKIKVIVKGNKE